MSTNGKTRRRPKFVGSPPAHSVSDETIKRAGDYCDRVATDLQIRQQSAEAREFNTLAHWLWMLAGAEPR